MIGLGITIATVLVILVLLTALIIADQRGR